MEQKQISVFSDKDFSLSVELSVRRALIAFKDELVVTKPKKRMLTLMEAHEEYGIRVSRFRKLILEGDIPYCKVGKSVLLDRFDLDEYFGKVTKIEARRDAQDS